MSDENALPDDLFVVDLDAASIEAGAIYDLLLKGDASARTEIIRVWVETRSKEYTRLIAFGVSKLTVDYILSAADMGEVSRLSRELSKFLFAARATILEVGKR